LGGASLCFVFPLARLSFLLSLSFFPHFFRCCFFCFFPGGERPAAPFLLSRFPLWGLSRIPPSPFSNLAALLNRSDPLTILLVSLSLQIGGGPPSHSRNFFHGVEFSPFCFLTPFQVPAPPHSGFFLFLARDYIRNFLFLAGSFPVTMPTPPFPALFCLRAPGPRSFFSSSFPFLFPKKLRQVFFF